MSLFQRMVLRALWLLIIRASYGSSSGQLRHEEGQWLLDAERELNK